jgi:hypothetical protein
VNQVKTRLAALSLLDRAFRQLDDANITARYAALDDEHKDGFQHILGLKGQEFDDATLVSTARTLAAKGRINGDLERISLVLTDSCLNDCVDSLGNAADDPSEGQLRDVLPAVIAKHGLAMTQVMLASVVCGEAVASPIIIRFLKHDEAWKLPPADVSTTAPVVLGKDESPERDALKAARKAKRAAEQEAARRRREQSDNARRRG